MAAFWISAGEDLCTPFRPWLQFRVQCRGPGVALAWITMLGICLCIQTRTRITL